MGQISVVVESPESEPTRVMLFGKEPSAQADAEQWVTNHSANHPNLTYTILETERG